MINTVHIGSFYEFEAATLEEMGMATRNAVPLREGRVLERLLILP